ncbi:MAG TPA: tetratricopeptide repeat protein [Woeseiaceae bacterium]|nr:tetratricopeptide repeat protein [Woeseiaceae bacterium]
MVLRRLIVLTALLLCAVFPTLTVADVSDDWTSGEQAFAAGDFESALLYFEMARDAGQGGVAVHYNIGVCEFKLNRFEDARTTFRYIADNYPKMRGLAEYNLGLVERRLGNTRAAQAHFIRAWELSPDDEKIRALAVAMLDDVEMEGEDTPRWFGSFGLRAGHDDNVALRDSLGLPAGVTAESPMVDLFVALRGAPAGSGGFLLDASAYAVAYPDADDFDQSEFRLGGLYIWRPGDWRLEGSAHVVYGTLGGSGFEREIALGARALRYLGDAAALDVQYRYEDIEEVELLFAGIAGTRQRFDLRYRWYRGDHTVIFRLGAENNDRLDAGVSPSRSRFHADYRYQPKGGWGFEAGFGFRSSDYDDLEIPRTEDLASISAALTRIVAEVWIFALQYQYSENDSSDPEFSYERNLITLGVLRTF